MPRPMIKPSEPKSPPDPERAFWLAIYRAVLAVAEAIKRYKLHGAD